MNPLLISGFGTTINVEARHLVIENRLKNERIEFYPHQVDYDSIVVDGYAGCISFEAMRWLSKHDIPLVMLNWNGNLLSTVQPKEPNNGRLRVKQYTKYLDPAARYDIAYKIVKEKVRKSHNLLLELSNYHEELDKNKIEDAFTKEYNAFVSYNKTEKTDISRIMTYEGKIAVAYWKMLTKVIQKLSPEFKFVSRKNKSYSWNMNASDEVNALFNYGYAILEAQTRRSINTIGLDPSVGYLHEIAHAKYPLQYDLQELYRWLIDLSVIQLLEDKKLKKKDFIVTENYHIRLRESTAILLIEKIKNNFNMKRPYRNKNFTYENILLDNTQQLANYLQDKHKEVQFNIPEVQINRNDNVDVRESLLNMTPEERRRLGINRNTLWYMKKNLQDGKMIKIYKKVKNKIGD